MLLICKSIVVGSLLTSMLTSLPPSRKLQSSAQVQGNPPETTMNVVLPSTCSVHFQASDPAPNQTSVWSDLRLPIGRPPKHTTPISSPLEDFLPQTTVRRQPSNSETSSLTHRLVSSRELTYPARCLTDASTDLSLSTTPRCTSSTWTDLWHAQSASLCSW